MTDSNHSRPPGPVLDPEWELELRRGQQAEGEAGSVDPELEYVHLLRHAREPEAIAPEQLDAIWSAIAADVDVAPAGAAWWRKAWVWWSAPALAAAAVLFVIIVEPGADEDPTVAVHDSQAPQAKQDDAKGSLAERASAAPAPAPASEAPGAAQLQAAEETMAKESKREFADATGDGIGSASGSRKGGSSASPFEASFAKLAPHGRLAVRVGVDHSRDELRSQLLAKARGGG